MLGILAQSDSSSSIASVIEWSAALLAILILAFAGYSRFKRWMNEADAPTSIGFTFSDLRELHRQGKITNEEFETARQKMAAAAKRMTGNLPDPLANNRKTPSSPPAEPGSHPGP
jgi:hypothetical protein